MIRALALAALGALALAACGKDPAAKAKAAYPPPAPFERTTADGTVRMVLADEIGLYYRLGKRLRERGVRELESFLAAAKADRARQAAKDRKPPPFERTLAWTVTARSPRLLGLKQAWYDYTGGAHPNHGSDGLIWRLTEDQEVSRRELFRPGADQVRLDAVLCDAIKAAKTARNGTAADPADWTCPHWADADFTLAPSTETGRIGGLMFLFDPYVIGPYVEGEYAITVPLKDFAGDLSPAYADQFAGAPALTPEP